MSQYHAHIIVFAFRYAQRHKTTAPWIVSQYIKKNIKHLTDIDIKQIKREIEFEKRLNEIEIAQEWLELEKWLSNV